ncbi:MYND finger domain containing protein [Mycena sanguinolenta]|uniref:MYND finger domain containing protein n=1 Tax=Mycena sanguinolenta TaxID=230812 RepID=A0A8H7CV82_9AGAR|nr:MYND finger domain containing protein [Mycena sanguinolenta]
MPPPINALTSTDDEYPASVRPKPAEHTNSCSACLKTEKDIGRPMRICSNCHSVFYCSKECQSQNWPAHKPMCGQEGLPKILPKLIKNLFANPILVIQLQACFVLAFELLQRSRCDEMLVARVDVAIEPADIDDFTNIFLKEGPPRRRKNVQGMLQLNAFTPARDPKGSSGAPTRRAVWRSQRAAADAAGFREDPVAIIDFAHAGSQFAIIIPSRIPASAKRVVTRIASVSETNEKTPPVTIENCLQFINITIRNERLLRTKMGSSDIRAIRDAATNPNTLAAIMLHAKIAREYIYESVYQTFLERRKRATGVTPSLPPMNWYLMERP